MDPVTISAVLIPAAIAAVALYLAIILWRNRPFTREGIVYRASRWTSGNRLWPTQVAVFGGKVVRYTPSFIGHHEETIAIPQVASVSIEAGLFFAAVLIETSGGSQPVVCHGHWKKDAQAIRDAISENTGAAAQKASAPTPTK